MNIIYFIIGIIIFIIYKLKIINKFSIGSPFNLSFNLSPNFNSFDLNDSNVIDRLFPSINLVTPSPDAIHRDNIAWPPQQYTGHFTRAPVNFIYRLNNGTFVFITNIEPSPQNLTFQDNFLQALIDYQNTQDPTLNQRQTRVVKKGRFSCQKV